MQQRRQQEGSGPFTEATRFEKGGMVSMPEYRDPKDWELLSGDHCSPRVAGMKSLE